ncbi:MAG: membrane protein insertase YidC [Burkholderiaceae bacterium]|nr:membrane protein insertase YidC [Burkholderiaceae bacterium]
MTDIRRTLLWAVFLMSLVLLWDAWNKHQGKPSMFAPPAVVQPAIAPPSPTSFPSAVTPVATPSTPGSVPLDTSIAETGTPEQVSISTDLVKATLDTKGGDLVRLELLKQADQNDHSKNVLLFDRSPQRVYLAQTGLIPAQGGANLPTHLTVMRLVPGERKLKEGSDELLVKFESPEIGGAKLVKTYSFKRASYSIGVTHEIINVSDAVIHPQLYLQLVRDGNPPLGESSFYFTFTGPAIYTDSMKFRKVDFESIATRQSAEKLDHEVAADNGWVAMVQHYFASAWLLPEKIPREYFTRKVDTNLYSAGMILPLGPVAAGSNKTVAATLFAGPQEERKLAELAPGLELVKDYGWFTILAKPLFWLLTHLHALFGNWGWAIVALVVLLKVAFYWLNASAYRSMAKMKAINPKVMALRDRLKDKPQEMQQEMMRIYREEKVNPLGGCLPIVAQMPFFIALYWVLLSSVEMRNAPWVGWITDLSARDPYVILPLLMTATSLFQTWLNPTPPDPMQAKMMWIMPLVFSIMFFFFPAGLVLYWLTNNILSIAQQYFINKQLGVLGK